MDAGQQIKDFLLQKLEESNLPPILKLEREVNVKYGSIYSILRALHPNPEIGTLIKFANYYNCSLDHIV